MPKLRRSFIFFGRLARINNIVQSSVLNLNDIYYTFSTKLPDYPFKILHTSVLNIGNIITFFLYTPKISNDTPDLGSKHLLIISRVLREIQQNRMELRIYLFYKRGLVSHFRLISHF